MQRQDTETRRQVLTPTLTLPHFSLTLAQTLATSVHGLLSLRHRCAARRGRHRVCSVEDIQIRQLRFVHLGRFPAMQTDRDSHVSARWVNLRLVVRVFWIYIVTTRMLVSIVDPSRAQVMPSPRSSLTSRTALFLPSPPAPYLVRFDLAPPASRFPISASYCVHARLSSCLAVSTTLSAPLRPSAFFQVSACVSV